jgi:hypothetical protein
MAESVPKTSIDAFEGSYIEYTELYVPKGCVDAYKVVKPWNSFRNIEEIEDGMLNSVRQRLLLRRAR